MGERPIHRVNTSFISYYVPLMKTGKNTHFIILMFRLNSCKARREAASSDFLKSGFGPLQKPFRAKLV